MAKLSFNKVKKATAVGSYVEKTVKFHDVNGEDVSGEVFVKFLSHDEVVSITKSFGDNFNKVTIDEYHKAVVLHAVYEDRDKPFFSSVDEVGQISTEFLNALYDATDEVLDLSGKRKSAMKTNFGANSSSMASVAEP